MPSTSIRWLRPIFSNAFDSFARHRLPRLAATLAYYTLFSVAPLLVIAIVIARAALPARIDVDSELFAQLVATVGASMAETIQSLVTAQEGVDGGGGRDRFCGERCRSLHRCQRYVPSTSGRPQHGVGHPYRRGAGDPAVAHPATLRGCVRFGHRCAHELLCGRRDGRRIHHKRAERPRHCCPSPERTDRFLGRQRSHSACFPMASRPAGAVEGRVGGWCVDHAHACDGVTRHWSS